MDVGSVRSLLFVPAVDGARAAKAWARGADAVIVDLEDAVAPARRDEARAALPAILGARPAGALAVVRVNSPTEEADAFGSDVEALDGLNVDAVLVPKATPEALGEARAAGRPLIALLESAAGVLHAEAAAAAPAVASLMFGPLDLAADLRLTPGPAGRELLLARSMVVLASAARGLPSPIDGPAAELRDLEVIRRETEAAKRLGFGAKACIHPAQVDVVNTIFSPTAAERGWARRVVQAYDDAAAQALGVVELDGEMVDAPVVKRARSLLARDGEGA